MSSAGSLATTAARAVGTLPKQPPVSYRADIDGLRAICVLAVILFHAKVPGFRGGYVGVDVFFVISGYLITRDGRWPIRLSRRQPSHARGSVLAHAIARGVLRRHR